MEKFTIRDVVDALGLEQPKPHKSNYNIRCINCDRKPGSKHLNINLRKNVYCCPRCGISGGIFSLYSLYTGTPLDEVRDELVKWRTSRECVGIAENKNHAKRIEEPEEAFNYPVADVTTRHIAYSALLSKLSLATDHKENLQSRGLLLSEIEKFEYKTSPVLGVKSLVKQLLNEDVKLEGVPGFYKDTDGAWTLSNKMRGILIPVRDRYGNIQGMQIRLDNTKKRKFRWVSSRNMNEGTGSVGWVHVVGEPTRQMIITEGPLKADIIHSLTGLSVISVQGVNALKLLEETLDDLRREGLAEVKTAFDMDLATNHNVQNGFDELRSLLSRMGFRYGTYVWNPRYKGLDDYIWECCLQECR